MENPLAALRRRRREKRHLEKAVRKTRAWSEEDQGRLGFYGRLVRPGDLVFDVGANLGNRSKVFLRLGARVVAFEPQPQCARVLGEAFRAAEGFCLERVALGAEVGEIEMHVSSAHTISSLSPEWIEAVRKSGRFADHSWDGREVVAVRTLDEMIAKHGRPDFVKIDVEGFELQVLSGLHGSVGAVSLEFVPEYLGNTLKCIDHLCGIGEPVFQIALEETMGFHLPDWVSADEIRRCLAEVERETFGDLYARF